MKKLLFCIICSLLLFSCRDLLDQGVPNILYVNRVSCSSQLKKDLVFIRVCSSVNLKFIESCFIFIDYKDKFNAGDKVKLIRDE